MRRAAPDTAFELVHLGEAESLGILDDQRVRVRVVDAALDDGCGNQHVELASREVFHDMFERIFVHLAVGNADTRFACSFLHAGDGFVDRADAVAHVVHLPVACKFASDGAADQVGIPFAHMDFDRTALVGGRHDEAHVAHA